MHASRFLHAVRRGGVVALKLAVFSRLAAALRQNAPETCEDLAQALEAAGLQRNLQPVLAPLFADLLQHVPLRQQLAFELGLDAPLAPAALLQALIHSCKALALGDLPVLGFAAGQGSALSEDLRAATSWAYQARRLRLAQVLPRRWEVPFAAAFAEGRPVARATCLLVCAAAEARAQQGMAALGPWLAALSAEVVLAPPLLVAAHAAWGGCRA